jgi:succinate dehydrogenase / fumarate reductase, iron-sulfur subunit
MAKVHMRVYRGNSEGGELRDYHVEVDEGMVVSRRRPPTPGHPGLPIWPCRWNCKAGEVRFLLRRGQRPPAPDACMTRMDSNLPLDQPITVYPMKSFPLIKDLVTDVSAGTIK